MTSNVGLQPTLTTSPVPHPHPHEYIAVVAADEGLVMRSHARALQRSGSCVRVSWSKPPKVEELSSDAEGPLIDWTSSAVIYGIVGILDLFNGRGSHLTCTMFDLRNFAASYLLVITARSDVGCLFDASHAIYGVKTVCAIPLVKDRAQKTLDAITSHNVTLGRQSLIIDGPIGDSAPTKKGPSSTAQFSERDGAKILGPVTDMGFPGERPSSPVSSASTPSSESLAGPPVAKAIANKMMFWTRLSKSNSTNPSDQGLSTEEQQSLDSMIHNAHGLGEPEVLNTVLAATAPPKSAHERHSELEDRIIRECIREYTKGCMYFAHHFDITRSLQHKHEQFLRSHTQEKLLAELDALPKTHSLDPLDPKMDPLTEPFPTLPLWRRVDRQFWWNEWLSKPFIDAGLDSYVLPIVQGHFQIASFQIPTRSYMTSDETTSPLDYIIASRRSRQRAGLRYQRRGVDDEAHVANFVETETILRVQRNGISNVFGFEQIRGSVPLFWTQSGYSMKPPPVLSPERTPEQNMDTLKRHFKRTIAVYGPHTVVNLAEQQGKESALTNAYRSYVNRMNNNDVRYVEYDFHQETKGMKYEKISRLINEQERTFESQGYFWISNNVLLSKQKGVFRVNCIDCLDRTNVVQSAFARHVLNMQLGAVGLIVPSQNGKLDMDMVFNDVWANNGDAISRAYAGTSALKGDFTRTGKRDLGGLLNDGVNSLARMYSATFSDWFCQAVIDFMLGYRTLSVFSEFLLKLQTSDPRELIRLSRVRAEAIATSVSRVLEEGEAVLSGWTMLAPREMNVKVSENFEEKILLLSVNALYIISYDYTLEKVKMYTRVPLTTIVKITKGAYILSPLQEASRDPLQNAGFSITWLNAQQVSSRMTSYSHVNSPTPAVTTNTIVRGRNNPAPAGGSANMVNRLTKMIPTPRVSTSMADKTGERDDTSFAAFKALPVDPARVRSGFSAGYAEPADDLTGAVTCKEVVDIVADAIKRACQEVNRALPDDFVAEADIVGVSEAQRMTSIYAKMEYGVKRLLWLGD
ncbi:SacI homology domain-containing protein [Phlebopus sp. FC_14]|nr:SacI homology domain-containing protein [Phlebopus sp. FC_14]